MKKNAENVKWEDIAELEAIANQCIYKGKEVARARAILKQLYGRDVQYNDDENCPADTESTKKD